MEIKASSASGSYGYMLQNHGRQAGTRMRFFPTPTESSATLALTAAATTALSATLTATGLTGYSGYFVVPTTPATAPVAPNGVRIQSVTSGTVATMTEPAYLTTTFNGQLVEPRCQLWYIRQKIPDQDDEIEKDVSLFNDMGAEF
jgi:hypothetical protein